MLAADVGHTGPAFGLPQGPHDLLFGMSLLCHLAVLPRRFGGPRKWRPLNLTVV